jgi:hypothetical protein
MEILLVLPASEAECKRITKAQRTEEFAPYAPCRSLGESSNIAQKDTAVIYYRVFIKLGSDALLQRKVIL